MTFFQWRRFGFFDLNKDVCQDKMEKSLAVRRKKKRPLEDS